MYFIDCEQQGSSYKSGMEIIGPKIPKSEKYFKCSFLQELLSNVFQIDGVISTNSVDSFISISRSYLNLVSRYRPKTENI